MKIYIYLYTDRGIENKSLSLNNSSLLHTFYWNNKSSVISMGCNNFAWRVSCAIIGLVSGVSAGATFGVVLHNPDAGAFGLFSGTHDHEVSRC